VLRINTVVHVGVFIDSTQIERSAKESVEEFHKASHNARNNEKKNQVIVRLRWKEPAIYKTKKRRWVLVKLRLETIQKKVLASMYSTKPYASDPTVEEMFVA
jgi:hypothetical protein